MPVAIITGASRGLGRATARALAERDWSLVLDARGAADLEEVVAELSGHSTVVGVPGDVASTLHRDELVRRAVELGDLTLLVNNASVLGPSPQPTLAEYPLRTLEDVYRVNVLAPLALIQRALPALRATGGTIVNVTSDAAVEGYEGWGGYGSSKAALEQLTNVLAAEEPGLRVHRFDPGDMRTRMHQEAFPDEDISDRPEPEEPGGPRARPPDRARTAERSLPSERPPGRGWNDGVAEGGTRARWSTRRERGRLRFDLPPELEAHEPPEARGIRRDGVQLLVATSAGLTDTTFDRIPEHLQPGDLVVVNTSATIPAAVDATAPDGTALVLHLSSDLGAGLWVVEPRRPDGATTSRWSGPLPGHELALCGGGQATLLGRYRGGRLWTARLDVGRPVLTWLARYGRPIRYGYVPHPWPLDTYQNVYASEPGSAEMPSAGRPFTAEVLGQLVAARHRRDPARAPHRRRLARGRRAPLPRALRRPGRRRPNG